VSGATLHLLCAGAAQGVVKALRESFERTHGVVLAAQFGPVGAMREKLLAGQPCDVLVVSDAMVRELQAQGALAADGAGVLGRVGTGIAARAGEPLPRVDTPEALAQALRGATELHFPDPQRATAGIHFASVLDRLGLRGELAARCRHGASGAASMAALANAPAGSLGCTQVSEILYSAGVALAGALPAPYALSTAYTACRTSGASDAGLAASLVALLAGDASRTLRRDGGFEFD